MQVTRIWTCAHKSAVEDATNCATDIGKSVLQDANLRYANVETNYYSGVEKKVGDVKWCTDMIKHSLRSKFSRRIRFG